MGGGQFALWLPLFRFLIKVPFLPHCTSRFWDREWAGSPPFPFMPPIQRQTRVRRGLKHFTAGGGVGRGTLNYLLK